MIGIFHSFLVLSPLYGIIGNSQRREYFGCQILSRRCVLGPLFTYITHNIISSQIRKLLGLVVVVHNSRRFQERFRQSPPTIAPHLVAGCIGRYGRKLQSRRHRQQIPYGNSLSKLQVFLHLHLYLYLCFQFHFPFHFAVIVIIVARPVIVAIVVLPPHITIVEDVAERFVQPHFSVLNHQSYHQTQPRFGGRPHVIGYRRVHVGTSIFGNHASMFHDEKSAEFGDGRGQLNQRVGSGVGVDGGR